MLLEIWLFPGLIQMPKWHTQFITGLECFSSLLYLWHGSLQLINCHANKEQTSWCVTSKITLQEVNIIKGKESNVMTPLTKTNHLTLKMTSIQLVKTSVINNSSFDQNSLTQTITLCELPIILGSNHLQCWIHSAKDLLKKCY